MQRIKLHSALFFIACCAGFMPAMGQIQPQNQHSKPLQETPAGSASCKSAKELENTDLFGSWVLELQSAQSAQTLRMQLKRNPEYAESLAGEYELDGKKREVFGDIEEGALELEESDNGKDISAIWKGRVSEGSCGRAFTGTRRLTNPGQTASEQNFILRRSGW
jgi:hypothetical protein